MVRPPAAALAAASAFRWLLPPLVGYGVLVAVVLLGAAAALCCNHSPLGCGGVAVAVVVTLQLIVFVEHHKVVVLRDV